jgi:hypothetical protein
MGLIEKGVCLVGCLRFSFGSFVLPCSLSHEAAQWVARTAAAHNGRGNVKLVGLSQVGGVDDGWPHETVGHPEKVGMAITLQKNDKAG